MSTTAEQPPLLPFYIGLSVGEKSVLSVMAGAVEELPPHGAVGMEASLLCSLLLCHRREAVCQQPRCSTAGTCRQAPAAGRGVT